jgi:hypothetical protein
MWMSITIVTTANTDEEGFELLKNLGMPFRRWDHFKMKTEILFFKRMHMYSSK